MKVVFVGDTSLGSRHFGCQLGCEAFREQFARTGLELLGSYPIPLAERESWEGRLDGADLVVVNGEGSLHHGRFMEALDVAAIKPAVLVNTVYEENPSDERLKNFRYIAARESLSAEAIRAEGVACDVVPDALFASSRLRNFRKPAPRRAVGRTDNAVKTRWRLGPVRIGFRPGFSPKTGHPEDYLSKLCEYERLCIGRFHAAIAASVLGIPFATWESNTWKTRGLMRDMGVEHLHFGSSREARAHVPEQFDPQIAEFASAALGRVEAMFDRIAELARR